MILGEKRINEKQAMLAVRNALRIAIRRSDYGLFKYVMPKIWKDDRDWLMQTLREIVLDDCWPAILEYESNVAQLTSAKQCLQFLRDLLLADKCQDILWIKVLSEIKRVEHTKDSILLRLISDDLAFDAWRQYPNDRLSFLTSPTATELPWYCWGEDTAIFWKAASALNDHCYRLHSVFPTNRERVGLLLRLLSQYEVKFEKESKYQRKALELSLKYANYTLDQTLAMWESFGRKQAQAFTEWAYYRELGMKLWEREWKGMPEFIQEDLMPTKTIKVHFDGLADMRKFAVLVNQKIEETTQYIWFPKIEKRVAGVFSDRIYADES
jgi:hypothetical protein